MIMDSMKFKAGITLILLAVCCSAVAQTRGMANRQAVYIEKGTRSVGLLFGYDSWRADGENGYDLLGMIKELEGNVTMGDVSASGSWFIKDNMSVGLRIGYTDTRVSFDSTLIASIELPGRNISRQTVNAALTCRGYLPLFDGRIMALFFEGRVSGSTGYNKSYRVTENGKEGSYSDIWNASLGLYPGVSVFVTDNISFEVQLPLVEGGCQWQKQDSTESGSGTFNHSFLHFKPSLLGLRMGMVFHF